MSRLTQFVFVHSSLAPFVPLRTACRGRTLVYAYSKQPSACSRQPDMYSGEIWGAGCGCCARPRRWWYPSYAGGARCAGPGVCGTRSLEVQLAVSGDAGRVGRVTRLGFDCCSSKMFDVGAGALFDEDLQVFFETAPRPFRGWVLSEMKGGILYIRCHVSHWSF
ncbi:hypothetical protein BV22DRAFT_572283 [Leucogyrophana mollusca]|uniref:Uncharacterized protein n=1 Tax=Leucogyrophana mollusca TaxID=85980 RepID=A0ACB8BEJ7_9AGAM|nr:hypothetical protein BV22DRAFT_572283 [Leucogyrophana mollusca]